MPAILYFDGKCPLCRREITLLQRLKRHELTLMDVHAAEVSAYQRQHMLRRLHLQFADKSWAIGLEANVAAWSFTPVGFLFKPLLWPGFRGLAEAAYERWASRRARRCDWIEPERDTGGVYGER